MFSTDQQFIKQAGKKSQLTYWFLNDVPKISKYGKKKVNVLSAFAYVLQYYCNSCSSSTRINFEILKRKKKDKPLYFKNGCNSVFRKAYSLQLVVLFCNFNFRFHLIP